MNHRKTDTSTRITPLQTNLDEFPDNTTIARHQHDHWQLLYAISGVMRVCTDNGWWVVPPTRGVWIPAGTEHWITMLGKVKKRTLCLASDLPVALPLYCNIFDVTPLLRELISTAAACSQPATIECRRMQALVTLIIEEASPLTDTPLRLPWPTNSRISKVCQQLAANPSDSRSIKKWADICYMSERTMNRHFIKETGLTFGQWRQQVRLMEALTHLGAGRPVAEIALDLGYKSPSAFSAMFRKVLGRVPSKYYQPGGDVITKV